MKGKRKPNRNYIPSTSPPQLFLYGKIKSKFKSAEHNKRIKTDRGYRYADIAIQTNGLDKTKHKIDVEYDGYISHRYRKKQDRERDLELLRAGWVTIRVDKNNVGNIFGLISEVINKCQ